MFGYITVLPGAFSAYRYIALQNDVKGEGPLQKYFLGESMVRITPFKCSIADVRWYSTVQVRISSRRTCTSQRIAYVFPLSHLLTVPLTPLRAPDPVLGARLKAWRRVDPALRQVGVRSDGCARSGARTDLAAPPLAQRLVLRRCALDGALPLPVPLEPHFCQEGVDPR